MPKKTLVIFTSIQGHYSLAEAITADLQQKYAIRIYKERDGLFDFYNTFYKFFPAVLRIPFYLTKRKKLLGIMHQY